MQRVNYDEIAHLYDTRDRNHAAAPELVALARMQSHLKVLDIGCGTGKWLAANRTHFPAITLVGVDLFRGMLRIAAAREPSVFWVQGDAALLPLRDQTFHYATNQFSYAHIKDKAAFFREIARTLRASGRFVLTNIDPWAMPDWIIYRFFPEALELDQRDYLPLDRLRDLLSEAGFVDVTIEANVDDRLEDLASLVQYVRVRHTLSQFLAIPDAAYEAGVRRVETALQHSDGSPIPSRRCFVTIRADRDGGQHDP